MLTKTNTILKSDLILRAAKGEKTDRVPIWLMRQAGRILPEYRQVRASVPDFKALVKNPELCAEVTIQPVDILDVDAAIIFSDILVIPEAMGCDYEMIEKKGPYFPKTIQTQADVDALSIENIEEKLSYVTKAIEYTKSGLNGRVPLIGFAGAPWTIFAYMVEGSGSKTFSKARQFLYTQPSLAQFLLQKITDATIIYLNAQVKAGANLIQVFDSWAGVLTQAQYNTFAIPYFKQICEQVKGVPITIFAKGAFFAQQELSALPCQTLGLDWNMNPTSWRASAPNKTLQGNLDPCVLYSDRDTIARETKAMIKAFGTQKYIANLGHGVYPDTDFNKVKFFIDCVKSYSTN